MARRGQRGTSPWIWIGCGCALLAFLVAAGLIGGGFFVVDQARTMVETMADPEARSRKAAEMLGAEALPEGYHAQVAMAIPFLFELVILSDRAPADDEFDPDLAFEEKAESFENLMLGSSDLEQFLFVVLRMRGRTDEDIQEVLAGKRRVNGAQADLNFDFRTEEELGSGSFESRGADVEWATSRGTIGLARDEVAASWAVLDVTCPDGSRPGALWVQRAADPAAADGSQGGAAAATEDAAAEATAEAAAEATAAGAAAPTVADPAALEAFLGHFDLCAG